MPRPRAELSRRARERVHQQASSARRTGINRLIRFVRIAQNYFYFGAAATMAFTAAAALVSVYHFFVVAIDGVFIFVYCNWYLSPRHTIQHTIKYGITSPPLHIH